MPEPRQSTRALLTRNELAEALELFERIDQVLATSVSAYTGLSGRVLGDFGGRIVAAAQRAGHEEAQRIAEESAARLRELGFEVDA